jgi:hypothetical protein
VKITALLLSLIVSFIGYQQNPLNPKPDKESCSLTFEGQVLEIGPAPTHGTGIVRAFQLVKYRVLHSCQGLHVRRRCQEHFENKEIIVDHMLLSGDELKDLKIGDKVCVGVSKGKSKDSHFSDGVLRKESDEVETFYLALDVFIKNCQCTP